MRFSYLFFLSLIDLMPKKDTVSYKFNSEPNRARQHLGGGGGGGAGVIYYESHNGRIYIQRDILTICDIGFKKLEK